jgi:hypothetical protein
MTIFQQFNLTPYFEEKVVDFLKLYKDEISFAKEIGFARDSYRFPILHIEQVPAIIEGVARLYTNPTIRLELAYFWEDIFTSQHGIYVNPKLLSLRNLPDTILLNSFPYGRIISLAYIRVLVFRSSLKKQEIRNEFPI